jgi:hypothetical protein
VSGWQTVLTHVANPSENKKKRDVVMKLVERGYPSDPVKTWKESQGKSNVIVEETDDEGSLSETSSVSSTSSSSTGRPAVSGPDYGYLLSMAILSLSQEKKDELLKQRDDKVNIYSNIRSAFSDDCGKFIEKGGGGGGGGNPSWNLRNPTEYLYSISRDAI